MLEAMGRLFERSNTAKGIAMIVLVGTNVGMAEVYQSHLDRTATQPSPPRIVDINGDGIQDKIVQNREYLPWLLGTKLPIIKDRILYGIGEINRKPVYLPKDLFDEYMRRNS